MQVHYKRNPTIEQTHEAKSVRNKEKDAKRRIKEEKWMLTERRDEGGGASSKKWVNWGGNGGGEEEKIEGFRKKWRVSLTSGRYNPKINIKGDGATDCHVAAMVRLVLAFVFRDLFIGFP
uniref:Uncharacterized protein n=1 Tax=Cucumis melo TaxID=3656 RepID=A0A9I9DFZ2_CUCME